MRTKLLAQISRISHKVLLPMDKYEFFVRFTAQDYYQYLSLSIEVNKLKGVRICRNYYTYTIDIYDKEDYDRIQDIRTKSNELIDYFYYKIREGLTQEQARNEQMFFVEKHPEYSEAYRRIYME